MNRSLREDALQIIDGALKKVQPDEAVRRALRGRRFEGRVFLAAIGKAAWQMAKAARDCQRIDAGVVLTKYGHAQGPLGPIVCREAGHPVPDENSFQGTRLILDMTRELDETDTVIFLISGGGSALFEKPLVSGGELRSVTEQLLACGAGITEVNTIRKRLSAVKGGRFAQWCAPARVLSIILSDIIGDPPDMIASGPAYPDASTCREALEIVEKYQLRLEAETLALLRQETPKALDNVETQISGSVRELCLAAAAHCRLLGYEPLILTDRLCCQAKEAGSFLSSIARTHAFSGRKLAFLAGGETVVQLTGGGKGGRNQELALAGAEGIAGLRHVAIASAGSDGTDGPTDAAGGIVDGDSAGELAAQGISIHETLRENDAYHALKTIGSLIFTGPTGTNVNDLAMVLIREP